MLIHVRKFTNIVEMEFLLQGGILGSAPVGPPNGAAGRVAGGGFVGLVGLTLTLTTPALNVTFAPATLGPNEVRDTSVLMFKDIKSQIEAAAPLLSVVSVNGCLGLIEAAPSTGITMGAQPTQQARVILGLPTDAAVSHVYGLPGASGPSFVAYNALGSVHVLFTWE